MAGAIWIAAVLAAAGVAPAQTEPTPEPTKLDVEATLAVLDIDRDGTVSRREAERMPLFRDGFRRLDKDRNGRLDRREIEAASVTPEPEGKPDD